VAYLPVAVNSASVTVRNNAVELALAAHVGLRRLRKSLAGHRMGPC
jgi:hypothetical protein